MQKAYVVTGILTDTRTVLLDETLPLTPMKVRLVVEPLPLVSPRPYVAEVVTLSREVMDRATAIRAQYGLKTPDAIHLAAAVAAGCDVFLTNDHRLDRFPGITIEVVHVLPLQEA
jgi:predicted nucleic acid-binding protein